jgi:hypothetical protein
MLLILIFPPKACGRQGWFEIRCSSAIVVNHIIGSAVSDKNRADEETSFTNCFSMKMGGVQPRTCFTINYELADDIVDDFVYFQFNVSFINTQNQR